MTGKEITSQFKLIGKLDMLYQYKSKLYQVFYKDQSEVGAVPLVNRKIVVQDVEKFKDVDKFVKVNKGITNRLFLDLKLGLRS